jgi:lipoprotein-anchoring transpeptidase ErfK/SrfK
MTFGDYVWDDNGVPPGPLWVRVDINAQLISVFRGEHEIGTAVILYGGNGKPTPIGAFHVLQKAKDYVSHTYDAPMPFMLRLTSDGVAIHASNVREGWATHGCIGVPLEFAKRLFTAAHLGDSVLITGAAKS